MCLQTDTILVWTNLPLATDKTGCSDKLDGISERCLHADTCQHHEGVFRHLYVLLLTPTGGATVTL